MITQEHDRPFARQFAAAWVAEKPDARYACFRCMKEFPVADPAGVASVTCPFCGFTPSEETCQNVMRAMAEQKAKVKAEAAKPEAAHPEAPRSDPPGLGDVIGNADAVAQIRTALAAHRARGNTPLPHFLLAGPGGTGKSMLAQIIAREIKKPIHMEMGQTLSNPARVCDVLRSLKANDVLFLEECHGLKPAVQEALYLAMEDGVFVPVVKAGKPVGDPVKLPPFTLIGATTDEYSLRPSMLQRFKYVLRLQRMTADELAEAIAQRAKRKGWELTPEGARMIAERSHGTPRLAVGLLDGSMDMALAGGEQKIDAMIVKATCDERKIDNLGLDKVARRYLACLDAAGGNPVRLNILASKLDCLSKRTVEEKIEADLVYLGLVEKSTDGRILTDAGRAHLRSVTHSL